MPNNSDQKLTSQLKSQPSQPNGLETFQPFIEQTSDKISDALAHEVVALTIEKTFNKLGNFIPEPEQVWQSQAGKFQSLSGNPQPKAIMPSLNI